MNSIQPKYEDYKDSGVEWLGEIPEHWEVKKLKHISKLKTGYTPLTSNVNNFSENGIVWIKPDNLNEFVLITDSKEKISKQGIKQQSLIPKGSILVCCIGTIGKFGIAGVELLTNQQINSIIFREEILPEYGKYLVYSCEEEFSRWANGNVIRILNTTSQGSIYFIAPPLQEQTAIASFIDQKTIKIDQAIAQKVKLIELLKERRQILIHNAVAKGIHEDVKLKDSGVEWIGEIPEHWEVKRLTKELFIQEGPGIMASDFQTEGIPLIRISGVKGEFLTLDGCNYLNTNKVNKKWKHFKLELNDLIISGSASTELVSEVAENVVGCICYTGLIRIQVKSDKIFKEYLKIFLGSKLFFTQIDLQKTGSTISHYGPSHLSRMIIVLPPITEQKDISNYVENLNQKIATAISCKEKEIEKLKEYKATLINSAVTGKIKVSNYA